MTPLRSARTLLLSHVVAISAAVSAQSQIESAKVGKGEITLPLPTGFSPACKEDDRFANAMSAMAPPDARVLTCWVKSSTWAALKAGATQAYPTMVITHATRLGEDWTLQDFERLKSTAQKQLASTIANSHQSAQDQLRRQNEALARQGISMVGEDLRRKYAGIYESNSNSLSYIVFREATVTANGTTLPLKETVSVSTILHQGSIIALTIVEQGMTEESVDSVRKLAGAWLVQFTAANTRAAK